MLMAILCGGSCLSAIAADADAIAGLSKTKTISIVGTSIVGLLSRQEPGPYNEVFDLITADYKGAVSLNIIPIRRAQRAFFNGQADCIFVGSDMPRLHEARGMDTKDIITSTPVKHISMMAYTRPEDSVITNEADLEGKIIALDAAAGSLDFLQPMFLPDMSYAIETSTPAQAFALLKQGRVDVAIAFDFDVSLLVKKDPSIANFKSSASYIIVNNEDVMVCKRSEAVELFIKHVDAKLEALRASGRLQKIIDN